MSRNAIYIVDTAGTLTAMRPSEPRSEDFMQLVAAHPELITDRDGALLLIRREHPIADRDEGGGRWSLDHLFVTQSGVPVLVELKRAVDTRLRREVIGQMLDYAANGTAYWQGGRIAESFAATMTEQGRDATAELASFLGATADPEQFWERVDAILGVTSRFAQNRTLSGMGRGIRDFHKRKHADARSPTRQIWRLPLQSPLSKAIRKAIPSCMGLAVHF